MSVRNRVGRNIEAAELEIEATIETKAIIPNKLTSYSEKPSTDIIKSPLLKSTETYSHASQFTHREYQGSHRKKYQVFIKTH